MVTVLARRPYIVGKLRLDKAVSLLGNVSRHEARRLIDDGKVQLNSATRRKQSAPVLENDLITISPLPKEATPAVSEFVMPSLDVLHRSKRFAVINKPAGLLSQPSEDRVEPCLTDVFHWNSAMSGHTSTFTHLQHRLDRFTSGACVFVTAKSAMASITSAWDSDLVERKYLALVEGNPGFEEEVIAAPIARVPQQWKFKVDSTGKPAKSRVRVLARHAKASLCEVTLLSGRTHQARVHLSFLGHPILNDLQYGGAPLVFPGSRDVQADVLNDVYLQCGMQLPDTLATRLRMRPLLHSYKLKFLTPIKGEKIDVTAPVPADLTHALSHFGFLDERSIEE